MKQQKRTNTQSRVTVHETDQGDDGTSFVWMDHPGYPRLRFRVGLSPEGAVISFEAHDRRLRPHRLEYPPDDPRWGPWVQVTRRLLADLPFGELERAARMATNEDRADAKAGRIEGDAKLLAALPQVGQARRGGRPPKSDLFYAKVADDYGELVATDQHPVARLAEQRGYSRNTAKEWVQEARRRGLLSDPPASDGPIGKAGGTLTELGRRVIEEATS